MRDLNLERACLLPKRLDKSGVSVSGRAALPFMLDEAMCENLLQQGRRTETMKYLA